MPLVNFAESSIIIMFLTPAPPCYQFGGLCALFHLSPFLLIGGDSISSEKLKSNLLNLPLTLVSEQRYYSNPRIVRVDSDASAFILLFPAPTRCLAAVGYPFGFILVIVPLYPLTMNSQKHGYTSHLI